MFAIGYYSDETILTYGKYRNRKLKDIPKDYLINIWETSKGGWDPEMRDYLKENIVRIKEIHRRTRGIGSKIKLRKNNAPKPIVDFICKKLTFPTKKAALESLGDISNRLRKGETGPVRAYPCPKCNGWHHTSKTLSEFKKTVERYKK